VRDNSSSPETLSCLTNQLLNPGRLLLSKFGGEEVEPQPPLTNRFASGAVDRVKFLSRTSVGRCPTWRLPIVD
jgi:hypothetical protein